MAERRKKWVKPKKLPNESNYDYQKKVSESRNKFDAETRRLKKQTAKATKKNPNFGTQPGKPGHEGAGQKKKEWVETRHSCPKRILDANGNWIRCPVCSGMGYTSTWKEVRR